MTDEQQITITETGGYELPARERRINRSVGAHNVPRDGFRPKALLFRMLPISTVGWLAYHFAKPRRSFGSVGEDLQVGPLVQALGITNGYYVDIGAFHPKLGSNTHFLHQLGWSGVNVDVDAFKISLFDRFRPNDVNVEAGVSSGNGERAVYRHDRKGFGSMTTLDRSEAERAATALGGSISEGSIAVLSLNSLLEQYGLRDAEGQPRQIDLINIDVENHEMEVLRSFDFETYRPKIMVVEIQADLLDHLQRTEVFRLLVDQGYDLAAWTAPSCIFLDTRLV